MAREHLTRGLLLRSVFLSAAALLCIHVYLETYWRPGAPAAQMLAGPTLSGRDKRVSAGPNRGVRSRVAYLRMLQRNGPGGKRNSDREEPPMPCCPPRSPRRKVVFHPLLSPHTQTHRLTFDPWLMRYSSRLTNAPSSPSFNLTAGVCSKTDSVLFGIFSCLFSSLLIDSASILFLSVNV